VALDGRSIPIVTAPHNQRRWIKNLIALALAPVLFVALKGSVLTIDNSIPFGGIR
jgi:hypothetical protein